MATQRYSVTPHPIDTLLTWVKSGEIAIPEIQRPFVWEATKVRNLLDSLYQGFPVGYLIAWRNPTVKLKDGTTSAGKRILIDGQQRVTALMASLLGMEVLTKDYARVRIRIAFNPLAADDEPSFEVSNPAIAKNPLWIADVSNLFQTDADLFEQTDAYIARNPEIDRNLVGKSLQRLLKIVNNSVGLIELAEDLDIETVTEIFIRVNSAGAELSQADFAMSKIAVNETYGGNTLRKAIEYFCHLAVSPDFYSQIEKNDPGFAGSEFMPKMAWLRDVNDDLYDPTYTDMLRVAFTSEFGRGKLQDLVALLSGRNFASKQYEESIAEESFAKLKQGVLAFMSKTHFDRITMILRSAGFVTGDLIRSRNAINFAYILYLRGRRENLTPLGSARFARTQSSRPAVSTKKTGRGYRPAGGGASLQRLEHRDGGAKATLEFAGQGKGLLSGDQAQLFDGLTAAAHGGGDALMAIGLDAIWIGVEHQGAELTAGSGGACHGRGRRGTPRPRPTGAETARTASHRKVRSADTAAWPDPCRLWRRGHAGRDHATAMALATAHT